MKIEGVSDEAQAELSNLFGMEPAPKPEPESSAEETDDESDTEEESNEESVENPDGESNEDGGDEDDSEEEESQSSEPDIEYIKANGKRVKIDFSDRDSIKRVFALAAGARQWQADRDSWKSKYESRDKEYKDLRGTMDFLESIKGDDEAVFKAVTGKSLQEQFNKWAEEQNMLGTMSEKEKEMYLSNQDHQRRIAEVEKREAALKAQLEKAENDTKEAAAEKQASMVRPFFFKYNFDGELGNNQLELRMNRTLWNEVESELSQFESVTPDMVEEAMDRVSNQIRQGFKVQSDRSVKKALKTQKRKVKKAAQDRAVKPAKTNKREEIEQKIASGDITGLLLGDYDLSNY